VNRWSTLSVALAALCACSAMTVAWSQHLSRAAWSDISQSRRAVEALTVRWSQLQIEQSTFSEHGRIERAARDRLDMEHPTLANSRLIVLGRAGGAR